MSEENLLASVSGVRRGRRGRTVALALARVVDKGDADQVEDRGHLLVLEEQEGELFGPDLLGLHVGKADAEVLHGVELFCARLSVLTVLFAPSERESAESIRDRRREERGRETQTIMFLTCRFWFSIKALTSGTDCGTTTASGG